MNITRTIDGNIHPNYGSRAYSTKDFKEVELHMGDGIKPDSFASIIEGAVSGIIEADYVHGGIKIRKIVKRK